jgi:hypothetical protein
LIDAVYEPWIFFPSLACSVFDVRGLEEGEEEEGDEEVVRSTLGEKRRGGSMLAKQRKRTYDGCLVG